MQLVDRGTLENVPKEEIKQEGAGIKENKGGIQVMTNITVDFSKIIGTIKPLHGVGQPPFAGVDFSRFRYLTDAGVPYSRLHDVGGAFGGFRWVDVPNLFRDFEADEFSPESYDFTYTDLMIAALMEAKVEPYFRLGVTIENNAAIKSYRIDPPKDYAKWARICEHIIRHYTEGWANGFYYPIQYWEIWNEPDSKPNPEESMMWHGTPEEYFAFYDVAAKHLKACFPKLKIGGYSACGFYGIYEEKLAQKENYDRFVHYVSFFDQFLEHIQKSGAPLDYFSWHCYDSNVERIKGYAKYVREKLDAAGYTHTESSCNEWSCDSGARGTYLHAAKNMATLLVFQDAPVDNAMIYDARLGLGRYAAIFDPDGMPYPSYYALTAFNRLYELKNQVQVELDGKELYAVAAGEGDRGCLVIANPGSYEVPLTIQTEASQVICLLTSENKKPSDWKPFVSHPKCDGAVPMPDAIPPESILTVLYHIKEGQ